MKKLNALLALLLALVLPTSAMAATVTETITLPVGCDYELLGGGLIVCEDYPECWLVDDAGTALTPHYADLDEESDYAMATFAISEELNATGLLDTTTGAQILPAQYGDVEILSPNWIAGVILTPTDDEDAPYYDWNDNHYDVVQTDVYYQGQLLLTLPAEEYGSMEAYGDYMNIITETSVLWLTYAGEKRVYERDYDYTSEFNEDYYTDTITHNATGLPAFTPDCPLTANQVVEPFMETDKGIIDLQGNVIAPAESLPKSLYIDDAYGGWICLSAKDEASDEWVYGVMDYSGKMLIPLGLARLPYLGVDSPWFSDGYLPALTTDGCLNVYDTTGALISSTQLPEGTESYDIEGFGKCAPIMIVDGDTPIVISATKGQLDVSAYEEIDYDYDGGRKLLCVMQNDLWGCIDMNGELVIPCIFEYEPDISRDNTRVLGWTYNEDYDRIFTLYIIGD